ncbi:hypothetical protein EVAR_52867_1 [Eumeta japonica]|uniref:Uncharacterized protein n=1 Tax=Eumeta variegata TaxID=151549 RepID=A0A4C1YP05_EUMVA|nr:hypothetical protein EVAR_52867_1 [Eumeta japonica]
MLQRKYCPFRKLFRADIFNAARVRTAGRRRSSRRSRLPAGRGGAGRRGRQSLGRGLRRVIPGRQGSTHLQIYVCHKPGRRARRRDIARSNLHAQIESAKQGGRFDWPKITRVCGNKASSAATGRDLDHCCDAGRLQLTRSTSPA